MFFIRFYFISLFLINMSVFSEQYQIQVPTRVEDEGKKYLAADLYTADTTSPKPVILIQTPYNKNLMKLPFLNPDQSRALQLDIDYSKYNFVIMDWRGFFGSSNAAMPSYDRGLDGYDAVEWIANQKWCNGKVGTWGSSALGIIQFQTAKHNPPHLVCCVPMVSNYQSKYSNFYYGGDLRKEHVESLVKLGFYPSTDIITSHPDYDNRWKIQEELSNYPDKINVPLLMVSGWFDHYPSDVIDAFTQLTKQSSAEVRDKHKLIMGPWLHGEVGMENQGVLKFPLAKDFPKEKITMFFDYYLLGAKNGYPLLPRIHYYQMGTDKWITSDDWFQKDSKIDSLFIHPNGRLQDYPVPQTFAPVPPDTIIYDPKDPTPSYGGERFNPFDFSLKLGPQNINGVLDGRSDVLVYTTDELKEDLILKGKLAARLFVASNRKDTDFGIRLCDVYHDGSSIIIRQGIKRMRFRDGYEAEKLMEPGNVYLVEINLDELSIAFKAGHKMRIIITSANYPHYDRNLNNGGPLYVDGDTLIATNLLYHDSHWQSLIIIPSILQTSVIADNIDNPRLLEIAPNPLNEFSYTDFYAHDGDEAIITVYNFLGQEIYSDRVFGLDAGINRYSLHEIYDRAVNGIYMLKITTRSKTYSGVLNISK